MQGRLLARQALLGLVALVLAACAKEDGSRIIGTWRAERLEVMSLKLPVGPEIRIGRNELAMEGDVRIPIAGITQEGDEVTLDTPAMIGMTFYFVEADRMYLDVPLLGHIYYRRVNDPAAGAVDVRREAQAPAASLAAASLPDRSREARAASPSVPEAPAPAYLQDYRQAVALMRQGNRDGAVRALNNAFRNGFHDVALLTRTPEFNALASDPRYQALLARYASS